MLRVTVGLSRKLTRDYNSTGFAIDLEGEVGVPLDDAEGVIEKVRELYDLADESLRDQIERHESVSAIASRDAPPSVSGSKPAPAATPTNRITQSAGQTGGGDRGSDPPATNKQVAYLLSLGKQRGLSTPQLESRVTDILGRRVGLYDLSKKQCGQVLDRLTSETTAAV